MKASEMRCTTRYKERSISIWIEKPCIPDLDLRSHIFCTSIHKCSLLCKHIKPISQEHPTRVTARVAKLGKKCLLNPARALV